MTMMSADTLPLTTRLAFATGAIPSALTASIIGFFLTPFLLEVASLPPSYVAAILLAARGWDAVTDPSAGYLISITRSRFGRLRMWVGCSLLPAAATYAALWLTPTFPSSSLAFGYYLAMYCAYQTAFTAYYVPYTSLTMQLSPSPRVRDGATSWRMAAEVLSVLLGVGAQGLLVAGLGKEGDDGPGYAAAGFLFGAVVLLGGGLLLAGVPQLGKDHESLARDGERVSFWAGFRIAAYGPYLYLTSVFLLSWTAVLLVQGSVVLYIKYALDLEDHFQYLLILLLLTAFASMPAWLAAGKRLGRKQTYALGMALFAIPLLFMFFAPARTPVPAYIAAACAGLGFGACYLLPWTMLPDVLEDYAVLHDGTRHDTVFYAFFVFGQKLASGLTLALSTLALQVFGKYRNPPSKQDQDAYGWDPEVQQPDSVDITLRVLVGIAPTVLLSFACIILYFYPITESRRKSNSTILKSVPTEGTSLIPSQPPDQ